MAKSVRIESDQIVTAEVRVGGKRIDDDIFVEEIKVECAINRIPRASIRIVDGSAVEEDFEISSSDDFVPGQELEIQVGYNGETKPIFKGIILRHAITLAAGGDTHLVISGADKAVAMTRQRHSRHFLDASDSDTLAELIREAGLSADVTNTGEVYAQALQHNATDWDYMLMRATANGMVIQVDDGKLKIAPPDLDSPELGARFGESLLSFEAEIDAATQVSNVAASAWDGATQEVINVQSREPTSNKQGNLSGSKLADAVEGSDQLLRGLGGDASQRSLESWANARHVLSRLARIRGRASFPGNADLAAGKTLELGGLGKRFNGIAYVSSVEHRVSSGEWVTEAYFGIDPALVEAGPNVDAPPAAGLRPGAHGLHIGKVVQVHDDPLGQGRIQVALPMSDAPPLWVRMMAPYAGKETGVHFLPEVNDEVVISFLDDDPDGGICLGALNSGTRPPPEKADEVNTLKTIRTRSGLRLQFNDEDNSALLETQSGRRLLMNDSENSVTLEDDLGNHVQMTESGISLTSSSDIAIKADGEVTVEAGTNMTLKAGADLDLKATNVSQTADASFSAKGSASSKLESSGTTIVKGTMVHIN